MNEQEQVCWRLMRWPLALNNEHRGNVYRGQSTVSLCCTFSWVAGTCPRKLLEHTPGVRALCTLSLPWFAALQVSMLTYVQCSPMGLTLPLPCAHRALCVEQGEITCAIFHVRSCPRYASRTSKCRVCSPSHAWISDVLQALSSPQWKFQSWLV